MSENKPNKIYLSQSEIDEVNKMSSTDLDIDPYGECSFLQNKYSNEVAYILESEHQRQIEDLQKRIEELEKQNEWLEFDKDEALESLCCMYNQYCNGPSGHDFMSAGENTLEVLEKHKLFIEGIVNGQGKFTDKAIELMQFNPNETED